MTRNNPSGSVQQCSQRELHDAHEWQAEFGAYFDVYCPGNHSAELDELRAERDALAIHRRDNTDWAWLPGQQPKPEPVEGLPGTWSNCGRRAEHGVHRHQVVVNEGPYENVLCLGYPGDPNGYTPPRTIQY